MPVIYHVRYTSLHLPTDGTHERLSRHQNYGFQHCRKSHFAPICNDRMYDSSSLMPSPTSNIIQSHSTESPMPPSPYTWRNTYGTNFWYLFFMIFLRITFFLSWTRSSHPNGGFAQTSPVFMSNLLSVFKDIASLTPFSMTKQPNFP